LEKLCSVITYNTVLAPTRGAQEIQQLVWSILPANFMNEAIANSAWSSFPATAIPVQALLLRIHALAV